MIGIEVPGWRWKEIIFSASAANNEISLFVATSVFLDRGTKNDLVMIFLKFSLKLIYIYSWEDQARSLQIF